VRKRKEELAMRDRNQGNRGQPKGPQPHVEFTSIEVDKKEIKTGAEIYNFRDERRLRFFLNDIFSAIEETEDRKAEHVFTIPPNTTAARIRVEVVGHRNAYDELTIDTSTPTKAEKEKKTGPRLEILATRHDETTFSVILTRTNPDNTGSPGKIRYIDKALEPQEINTEDSGVAVIEFQVEQQKRQVVFFLPENIGEKLAQEIPALKKDEDKEEKETASLTKRITEAFQKGQKFYKEKTEGGA